MDQAEVPRLMKRVRLVSDTVQSGDGFHIDFQKLQLDSFDELDQIRNRYQCDRCKKMCMYYCPECVLLQPGVSIPRVCCPINIHVLRHPKEKPGKSSAIPLNLLAPDTVFLHTLPVIPEIDDSVLLFPSDDAEDAETMDWNGIKNLIIIDCTWYQVTPIMRNPVIQKMRKVKFSKFRTANWRYITCENSDAYLSSVETAFFMSQCKVAWEKRNQGVECQVVPPDQKGGVFESIDRSLDNMLWFFAFFHKTVMHATKKRLEENKEHWEENVAKGYLKKVVDNVWDDAKDNGKRVKPI
eukprot:GDKJ01034371.1.p1 GENE.GDKJ01034371.1~~GDKJ01034371.1.p1  ORF type:complete len:296 (+),score=41.88 GDKJ01034371.1:46-933(+)